MKIFDESEVKYLAGLLDADGCLSFKFCKTSKGNTYLYLVLALSASESVDRGGYVVSLGERIGRTVRIPKTKPTHSGAWKWSVQSRRDLELILPRVIKHMVVKARHWDRLYTTYCEMKGRDVTEDVEHLKHFSQDSRKDVGPLKPKNHPTWAWLAGYLDGDGCYTFARKQTLHVGAIAHIQDSSVLEFIQRNLGGSLYEPRDDNTRLWRRGLGMSHSSFAKMFLTKMVRHSRLKKHKIEKMLNFHNQPQRLNETNPKG